MKAYCHGEELEEAEAKAKAAQDTLNSRWNKVLDNEDKYGDNRHTKSYPKCKLLPEFDDEAIEPIPQKNNMTDQPDRPPRGRDRAANDAAHKSAHNLRELLDKKPVWPGPSMDLGSVHRRMITTTKTIILIEYQLRINTEHNKHR